MSANYWESSQHLHWEDPTYESASDNAREDGIVEAAEEDDLLKLKYPLPEPRLLHLFLQQQVSKLGKRLNVRQIVLATAFIFIRRFYMRVEIRRTNPYLVVATAFYLACKIEECPQHIKVVVAEARTLWPDLILPDIARLGECEFWVISEIRAQLIVHHPYRSLRELHALLDMSQDEFGLAWSVVNDHYITDLPLRYAPHIIAAMAVVMTLIMRPSQGGGGGGNGPGNVGGIGARQTASPAYGSGGGSGSSAAALAASAAPALRAGVVGPTSAAAVTQTIQGKGERLMDWLVASKVDLDAVVDCTQHMISLYVVWDSYNEKECKEQVLRFVRGSAAIARHAA